MALSDSILTTRNSTLADLAALLERQQAAKLDVVTAAGNLTAVGGELVVAGAAEPVLSSSGVTRGDVVLRPTSAADGHIADKLRIPIKFLRRIREEHVGLYDVTVNTLLGDEPDYRFLVRGLVDGGTNRGVVRALLSSSYRVVDNVDVLTTVLQGIRDAGVEVEITQCDLSETRMYVKVRCDEIGEYAPQLLGNYRSPFTGARGAENPLVHAGFVVANSETGHARTTITPQLTVQICNNGLTMTKDALATTHLGARMPEGVVRWSHDTRHAELDLITKQARDAVTTFLDRDYVRAKLAEIERAAGVAVTDPTVTLEHVGQELRFTEEQRANVLAHFIQGGDPTSGGVLHAVTSAAQLVEDADISHDMERHGLTAMSLAAAHASGRR
jgi:hypothetical protein